MTAPDLDPGDVLDRIHAELQQQLAELRELALTNPETDQ